MKSKILLPTTLLSTTLTACTTIYGDWEGIERRVDLGAEGELVFELPYEDCFMMPGYDDLYVSEVCSTAEYFLTINKEFGGKFQTFDTVDRSITVKILDNGQYKILTDVDNFTCSLDNIELNCDVDDSNVSITFRKK